MVITIFDVLGIQDYLFGSNKLVENIGGSYLVEQTLNSWLPEVAQKLDLPEEKHLVYNAGGNAVFAFEDMEQALSLAREFSKKVLQQAPGLQVACCHHQTAPGTPLGQAMKEAFFELRQIKADRTRGDQQLLGLGVTQPCDTGAREPAVIQFPGPGTEQRLTGPTALAKVENRQKADESLRGNISIPQDYDFPLEFDDLGRSMGEKSYIGVVHLDGNGIGDKLQEVFGQDMEQEPLKQEIHKFSVKVSEAGYKAIISAVDLLMQNIQGNKCADSFDLQVKGGKTLLPFRPLVYGGDDITFVCDGRIALDLACACLRSFHEKSGFHACAGVALCKSHYPFYRAYALAEQLCRNSKEFIINTHQPGSAIDWHILAGGPVQDLHAMRSSEYTHSDGHNSYNLTCRPYQVLPENENSLQDWSQFRNTLLYPLQNEEPWTQAHSRLKGLINPLSRGKEAAKFILQDWKSKGYELPRYAGLPEEGFQGPRTPYLDALELLDFMVFLDPETQQEIL
jgi:hypothetical protein